MKQTRRGFLGRIAAAAAVAAVAPSVEAKAGDDPAIREARAEGYERGRAIEQAKAESRVLSHGARVHLEQFDSPSGSHTHSLSGQSRTIAGHDHCHSPCLHDGVWYDHGVIRIPYVESLKPYTA